MAIRLVARLRESLSKAQLALFPGMVLAPSKQNPRVKRWQQTQEEPAPAAQPKAEEKPVAPKRGADAYLSETVNFGGEQVSRGEAIRRLHDQGASQADIDAWLAGNEASKHTEPAPATEPKAEPPPALSALQPEQPVTPEPAPVVSHPWAPEAAQIASMSVADILKAAPSFGVPIGKGTKWRIGTNEKAAEIAGKDAANLTEGEIATLRAYSGDGRSGDGHVNAYYTGPEVAAFMWKLAAKHGFTGGSVLEPSCGNGVFMHFAPKNTQLTAVEMSPVSGGIAKLIHPHADISIMPFEHWNTSRPTNERFDMVIGNPPFTVRDQLRGMDKSHIKRYDAYFMSAGLDRTKPGGMLAYVEPNGIMGIKAGHYSQVRSIMTRKAQVIAAYRLPTKTFGRQGTEQSCDVILMRKLPDDVAMARGKMNQEELASTWSQEEKDWVNGRYFSQHADNTLGTLNPEKAFRGIYVEGECTPALLDRAAKLPETDVPVPTMDEIMSHIDNAERANALRTFVRREIAKAAKAEPEHRVGDVKYEGGSLYRLNENHRWELVEDPEGTLTRELKLDSYADLAREVEGGMSMTSGQVCIAGAIGGSRQEPDSLGETMYQATQLIASSKPEQSEKIAAAALLGWRCRRLQTLQSSKAEADQIAAQTLRMKLPTDLADYDGEFQNPRGDTFLSAAAGRNRAIVALLGAYKDDGSVADYVLQKTYYSGTGEAPTDSTSISSVASWLSLRQETFTVADIARAWTGGDEKAALEQMLNDPSFAISGIQGGQMQWQPMARYATGKIVQKADDADELAEKIKDGFTKLPDVGDGVSAKLTEQADTLRSLLPHRPIEEIEFSPRSSFIPVEALNEWYNEEPVDEDGKPIRAYGYGYNNRRTEYKFERTESGAYKCYIKNQDGRWEETDKPWGNESDKANILNYLNRFRMKEDDKAHYENMVKTFREWVMNHQKWSKVVEEAYNNAYADSVEADYSTAQMDIPNLVKELPDRNGKMQPFSPHGVQFRTVRHMMDQGLGIIALDVGVGKTLTGLMLIEEMRKEQRSRKPVIVTPKSVVAGWERAYRKYFAGADPKKVLIVDGVGAEREKQLQDAANNDWDLVIMSRDTFGMIPMRQETQDEYIQGDFWVSRSNIMGSSRKGKRVGKEETEEERTMQIKGHEQTAKEQEKARSRFAGNKAAMLTGKHAALYWEDMGFDMILADEAHAYKNLESPQTREYQGIKYLPAGADPARRSLDFAYKARWIRDHNGGRNVFGMTATPTPNSAVEIYSMLSYVCPEAWKQRGVNNVEDFIERFCSTEPRVVINTDGSFGEKPALVGFKNLRELRSVYRQYITQATAKESGIKTPKGTPTDHIVEMPPATKSIYVGLRERAAKLSAQGGSDDSGDHIFSCMSDMEKASISLPLYYGEDAATGQTDKMPEKFKSLYGAAADTLYYSPKMDTCIEAVKQSFDQNKANMGGQLIFCDKLEMHGELKKRLILAGVPEEQIGTVNASATPDSADRLKIADAFNAGKLRVVIGNTDTMGEGMSFQKRGTDVHHLDYRWNQAGMHQRNGRIVRQGNPNDEVKVHRYMMQGSFDAYRIGVTDGKRTWQDQILSGNSDTARFEDTEEMSPEQIQIALADNPEEAAAAFAAKHKEQEAGAKQFLKRKAYDQYTRLLTLRDRLKRVKSPKMREKLAHDEKLMAEQLAKNEHFEHKDFLRTGEPVMMLPSGMMLAKGAYVEMEERESHYSRGHSESTPTGRRILVKVIGVDPVKGEIKTSSPGGAEPTLTAKEFMSRLPAAVEGTPETVMRSKVQSIGRYSDVLDMKESERVQMAGEIETALRSRSCFVQTSDGIEFRNSWERKEDDKMVIPTRTNLKELRAVIEASPGQSYEYDKRAITEKLNMLLAQEEKAA